MLQEKIDKLIMVAMKSHEEIRTKTLRSIKAEFLKWKTAKENVGKELTDSVEIQILKKMIKTRTESADLYEQAHRLDLAEAEKSEINILEEFVPKEATEEEIIKTLVDICNTEHIACDKRNMGILIRKVKEALPNADGAKVAQIVKSNVA